MKKIWWVLFLCLGILAASFVHAEGYESYWSTVPAVIDEGFLQSVRQNEEALGDGGRLYIPEVGIDVALYRVRFINLDPVAEVMEVIPEVTELPSIQEAPEDTQLPPIEDAHEDKQPPVEETPGGEQRPPVEEAAEVTQQPLPEILSEGETEITTDSLEADTVEGEKALETEEDFWIDLGIAQIICDEWDSAVWLLGMRGCGSIIADHASQGFDGIKAAHPGTMAYLETVDGIQLYVCENVIQGHNTGTYLTDSWWNRLVYDGENSLVMYTCNENWENITIALWQKVEAWVGE